MLNPSKILYIAEVSANHRGKKELALEIISAAAYAGANAVKFQTYTPDTMTLDNSDFSVKNYHELWGGAKLYDLYAQAQTPWEWHADLFSFARSLGLIPFSSPFDLSALELLESLGCQMYKIASLETGDHRLIRAVAETGKPIIVSTGATEWEEIIEVVDVVKSTRNNDLTLLVCTSSYPADPKDSHVSRIKTLRDKFQCKVGISDHTLGIGASVAAVSLGAVAVEKHLTIRRSDGGADGAFSMEPDEFKQLICECNNAQVAIGNEDWKIQPSEYESRRLRRSLYIVRDVRAGEVVSHENLRAIRPGEGASPKYLEEWIGKKFKESHQAGTPMKAELLE